MANEITVQGTLQYANPAQNIAAKSLALGSTPFSITGKEYSLSSQSIPTTAGGTHINIPGLGSAGWFFIKNNDSTNYVQILNATSGTVLLRILPGEFAMGRFDSGVTAPTALANTGAVVIEYLILEY